jgi:hypothetical protein
MAWIKDLEEQLTMFRPEGALTKHDDQIDCLSMLDEFAYAPSDTSTNSKEYIGYVEEEEYVNSYIID